MASIEDIVKPHLSEDVGSTHPITQIQKYIISILEAYGFSYIEGGLKLNLKNSILICLI